MPKQPKIKTSTDDFIGLAFTAEHGTVDGKIACFENYHHLLEWSGNEILKVAGSLGCMADMSANNRTQVVIGAERLNEFIALAEGRLRGVAAILDHAGMDLVRHKDIANDL